MPRMTPAQRRAARCASSDAFGRLTRDPMIPPSTWRRMIGCMWRAGWIEETADNHCLTAAGLTEARR